MVEPRRWTRKERKDYMKERYFRIKTKVIMVLAMLIILLVLVYTLAFAIREGLDPFLVLLLVVGVIVFIPIAIFLIDLVWHEAD